jgi:hypothetical protein
MAQQHQPHRTTKRTVKGLPRSVDKVRGKQPAAAGISNRPPSEEQREQQQVPPRGQRKGRASA